MGDSRPEVILLPPFRDNRLAVDVPSNLSNRIETVKHKMVHVGDL